MVKLQQVEDSWPLAVGCAGSVEYITQRWPGAELWCWSH